MKPIEEIGRLAKQAAKVLAVLTSDQKNALLKTIADVIEQNEQNILMANKTDLANAKHKKYSTSFMDRLTLTSAAVKQMAKEIRRVEQLQDPVGEILSSWKRPNELTISKVRIPFGVIGMIYESRPNVTVDSACLCLKTGNAVILKGGSEALETNKSILKIIGEALQVHQISLDAVQLIEDSDRETTHKLMQLDRYIDVLIPRGGANLIQSVIQNATIPVIETGVGNCHVYVETSADSNMALQIIVNAKTSKPSVCNAVETVLVDRSIAESFLPQLFHVLTAKNVEMRGCSISCEICKEMIVATKEDWSCEYLDLILAVKVVENIDEAVSHIAAYGSNHSEAIITNSKEASEKFSKEVDAAVVYVNASTRFTDGGEFGFGAEIGISTQKLHVRGPIGLPELTTYKYIVHGQGQIRS